MENPYLETKSEENPYLQVNPYLEEEKPSIISKAKDVIKKGLPESLETIKALATVYGSAEAAINLLSQTYGLPASGLAALAGVPFGKSKEFQEATSRALIYEPQTEAGRKVTEAVSYPFKKLGEVSEEAATYATKKTDSPLVGTAVGTAIQAAPLLLPALRRGRETSRALEVKPEVTPEVLPVKVTPIRDITESNTYQGKRMTSSMGPNDKQLVAKDASGKDIGRIWYTKEEGGITVRRIDADQKVKRQGVGTQLIEEAQKDGKVIGFDEQTVEGKAFTEGRKIKEVRPKMVELRHYTGADITEATLPDANGLVWFTEGESYLKGSPKKPGKWGYITTHIPENKILRIDETPGALEEYLSSPFGRRGRSKVDEMAFAESKGYLAVKRGEDISMRAEQIVPESSVGAAAEGRAELQSAVIPGLKEFVEQDIIPKAQQLGSGLKDTFERMKNVVVPRSGVKQTTLDKIMEMKGERDKAEFILEETTKKAEQFFDKMPQPNQIDFVDRIKTGKPQLTRELQQTNDMFRTLDDGLYDEILKYKPSLNWKENHFRVMWKQIPGKTEEGFRGLFRRPLEGTRGFLKKSTLEDISEGIEKGGIPFSYNPVTNFRLHYADSMKFITANRMWEGLKDIKASKFVKLGDRPPEGFVRLDDRIAKVYFHVPQGMVNAGEWWVERGAGRLLNNYLSRDMIRDVAAGRGLMWLKNSTTAVELGFFNPFHAIFETLETVSSGVGLGARKIYNIGILQGNLKAITEGTKDIITAPITPYTTARLGGKFLKYASNKKEFLKTVGGEKFLEKFPAADEYIDDLFRAGGKLQMHQDYRINSIRAFKQSLKQNNYIGAAFRSIPALNEVQFKPLFEKYIPRLKVGMWLKEYPTALMERQADILSGKTSKTVIVREIWDSVENRLGEMNFDNLFWNNTFKTGLQATFRSTTWKLGNIRMFGRSVTEQSKEFFNAFKEQRMPRLSPEMAWVWGLASTTAAMGAITQRLLSGEWPSEFIDFYYPKIDKEGHRISPQTYIRDLVSMAKAPMKYIEHSLSGYIGRFMEVINNKDFYNVQIHDPEDSFFKQRIDDLVHMVPIPFSFGSVKRTKEQDMAIGRQILSFFAPRAPYYIEQTNAEQKATELMMGHIPPKPRTKEEFERAKRAKGYAEKINKAYKEKRSIESIMPEMASDLQSGKLQLEDIKRVERDLKEPLERRAERLSLSEIIKVWDVANEGERIRLKPIIIKKMSNLKNIPDERLKRQVNKFIEEAKQTKEENPYAK